MVVAVNERLCYSSICEAAELALFCDDVVDLMRKFRSGMGPCCIIALSKARGKGNLVVDFKIGVEADASFVSMWEPKAPKRTFVPGRPWLMVGCSHAGVRVGANYQDVITWFPRYTCI